MLSYMHCVTVLLECIPSCILITSNNFEFCLIKCWPVSAALDVLQGAHKVEVGEPVFLFWIWRHKRALLPAWWASRQGCLLPPHRPLGPSSCGALSSTAHQLLFIKSFLWLSLCVCPLLCIEDTVKAEMVRRKSPSLLLTQAIPTIPL